MAMDMTHSYDRARSAPEGSSGAPGGVDGWPRTYTALTCARRLCAHWDAPVPDQALTLDEWELLVGSVSNPTHGRTDG